MRVHFAGADSENVTAALRDDFAAVAAPFAMRWRLEPVSTRRRVLVMVSRYGHCLNDLLFRTRSGDLPIDVVAVVSNHRDHEELITWHGIPFFHVPVTSATKPEAEARLLEIADSLDVELVVLARYTQVLSDGLCGRPAGCSTSTTRSCRASRAPSPTTRHTTEASSSSARPPTASPPTSTKARSSPRKSSASTTATPPRTQGVW